MIVRTRLDPFLECSNLSRLKSSVRRHSILSSDERLVEKTRGRSSGHNRRSRITAHQHSFWRVQCKTALNRLGISGVAVETRRFQNGEYLALKLLSFLLLGENVVPLREENKREENEPKVNQDV